MRPSGYIVLAPSSPTLVASFVYLELQYYFFLSLIIKIKKKSRRVSKKKMQHVCVPSALKVSSHTSNPSKHNPSYSMADHVQYGYNRNKNIVNDKILKGVLT
jgi:hypothetical protein